MCCSLLFIFFLVLYKDQSYGLALRGIENVFAGVSCNISLKVPIHAEFRVFLAAEAVARRSAYGSLYIIHRTLNKATVSDSRFQSRELIMYLTIEGNNQTIFADICKTSQPCADTGRNRIQEKRGSSRLMDCFRWGYLWTLRASYSAVHGRTDSGTCSRDPQS